MRPAQIRGDHVRLSKGLSKILRHKAEEYRIPIRSDGYMKVADILRHQSMRHYTAADVRHVVENNDKKRFVLLTEGGEEFIRAQQGHSMASVTAEELLEPVSPGDGLRLCYHGTYEKCVDSIKASGLNRMSRNHVHLTPALPGDASVISGMRRSADVIVAVDVEAAMRDGIAFYRSGNNVILSPGHPATGCIPPCYLVDYIRSSRKRRAPGSLDAAEDEAAGSRYPHYYCVIDFEATCLENKKIDNQEIIEFPAVLLNADTMEQEAEFHSYVRPVRNPVLSPFCKQLTGIEQHTVDAAPAFDVVYGMFQDFMRAHGFDITSNWTDASAATEQDAPPRRTVEFVSYGDFEFRTILPGQCRLVGIDPPAETSHWINAKMLFTRKYRKARQRGWSRVLHRFP